MPKGNTPLSIMREPLTEKVITDEENTLNILKTVTEQAYATSPDFSLAAEAINRTTSEAETDKSHELNKRIVDVGVKIAGYLEPAKTTKEKKYGWK